jgi:hypothetical protein
MSNIDTRWRIQQLKNRIAEDRARAALDSLSVRERLQALDNAKGTRRDAKATVDAYRRIILDLLHIYPTSRRTLGLTVGDLEQLWRTLGLSVGDLERLWFPKEYKKKRRRNRAVEKFREIEFVTDYYFDQQQQGARKPRTEAMEKAASAFGVDIDSLRKQRYRCRKRAGL